MYYAILFLARLGGKNMNVTVYCGANIGTNKNFTQATIQLGSWIAKHNHTLVYGGGIIGLMGILADTVLEQGGNAIGIMPDFLQKRELSHANLTELKIVESMAERKQLMADMGRLFIALPGGPGTLEEITDLISWSRIGKNPYPCCFVNIDGYYDPIKQQYHDMMTNGFLTAEDFEKIIFLDSIDSLSSQLAKHTPPEVRQY